jgi:hypothetical protein
LSTFTPQKIKNQKLTLKIMAAGYKESGLVNSKKLFAKAVEGG